MTPKTTTTPRETLPIAELLETLELLVSQARAYERALPPDSYPARAAVATLGELARQALNEARDIAALVKPPAPAAHPFSPREYEVLTLVAQGLTNREIAYRLGISDRTVQFHVNAIFNKTGAQSRTEAVALALTRRWLEITDSE
ncbi:MAG: response regulator transcription factor [Anaerolineae bacterium]